MLSLEECEGKAVLLLVQNNTNLVDLYKTIKWFFSQKKFWCQRKICHVGNYLDAMVASEYSPGKISQRVPEQKPHRVSQHAPIT